MMGEEPPRARRALAQWRASQSECDAVAVARRHVHAHESAVDEWTQHRDERPADIREEVWRDPLYSPVEPANAVEARFLETRQHYLKSGDRR